ncbi:MAG: dihydrolipoyl dehydrogenase [Propionibacteriaceae bacterium]|jgi:dihydrolipoamide dehydrogenase|nr:dihydrolipoyl dehydrogenase [Propionibacteriaceae bacterium]
MAEYDVIILGGGPGGYIAAERLGHGCKSVLLIEKDTLGGTCLNVGCIPTKALLNSVKLYEHARDSSQFGVVTESASYDWATVQEWKNKTVTTLVGGVAQMMKRLKVTVVNGEGHMTSPTTVEVNGEEHSALDVIIATGSLPAMPPIPGSVDNPSVVDSTRLLSIDQVPPRLTIIGGGVIGVEFASIFSRLGSRVTIVEMMDEILPFMESDLAARLRTQMPAVDFRLGAKVEAIEGTTVVYSHDEVTDRIEGDLILMAVGRRPLVNGWGADTIGLDYSPAGITVDDQMRTNLPHVWAVGDVTGRSLLAHAAYRMGEIAAAHILDGTAKDRGQVMRWDTIPWALYSSPEAAGVGLTEEECTKRGIEVNATTVPLVLSGRFIAEHGLSRAGMVKVVAETETRVIRGIQVMGPYAPEMIWGAAGVLEMEFTIEDVRQLVFPHPTVSEGIREAVWAFPDKKRNEQR